MGLTVLLAVISVIEIMSVISVIVNGVVVIVVVFVFNDDVFVIIVVIHSELDGSAVSLGVLHKVKGLDNVLSEAGVLVVLPDRPSQNRIKFFTLFLSKCIKKCRCSCLNKSATIKAFT